MDWREKVNARLLSSGMSLRDLSERANLGYNYLWRLLRAKDTQHIPSRETKEKIAVALGMQPDDLDDALSLPEYLTAALDNLPEETLARLAEGTSNDRVREIVSIMLCDPRWDDAGGGSRPDGSDGIHGHGRAVWSRHLPAVRPLWSGYRIGRRPLRAGRAVRPLRHDDLRRRSWRRLGFTVLVTRRQRRSDIPSETDYPLPSPRPVAGYFFG